MARTENQKLTGAFIAFGVFGGVFILIGWMVQIGGLPFLKNLEWFWDLPVHSSFCIIGGFFLFVFLLTGFLAVAQFVINKIPVKED